MFLGWVAHRGPQSRRRRFYWLRTSSQACLVYERRSVRFSLTPPPFGFNSSVATGAEFDRQRCADHTAIRSIFFFGQYCPTLAHRPFDTQGFYHPGKGSRPHVGRTQSSITRQVGSSHCRKTLYFHKRHKKSAQGRLPLQLLPLFVWRHRGV